MTKLVRKSADLWHVCLLNMDSAPPPPALFEGLEDIYAVRISAVPFFWFRILILIVQPDYFTAADVVSYPVTSSPTPCNSLHGSDGSSHGGCASSSDCSSPPMAPSGDEPQSPGEELLQLIDWKNHSRNVPRRIRGLREETHHKHVQAEKKRRDDLASAIDDIGSLVPSATGESALKRTKVATLQDAKEYFKRVQDVALMLVQENRRLQAAMQGQGVAPATGAPTHTRASLQGQEVVRLLVMSGFIMWLFVGVPTPWTSSAPSVSFSTRSVLETETGAPTPLYAFFSTAAATSLAWAAKTVIVLVAFSVVWICTLLQDMPHVSAEQLRNAKEHVTAVEMAMEKQNNRRLGHMKTLEALAAVGKSPPTSKLGKAMFLMVQIIRAALNVVRVGLWLERLLVYICGRQEVTLVEARAYMFAAEQHASASQFVGFTLASASSLLVANASTSARDELALRMGMSYAQASSQANCLAFRALLLAEKLLPPSSATTEPHDYSDWTAFRVMVQQGDNLEQGVDQMLQLMPLLKGPPQSAAMACAGLGLFCMRVRFLIQSPGRLVACLDTHRSASGRRSCV